MKVRYIYNKKIIKAKKNGEIPSVGDGIRLSRNTKKFPFFKVATIARDIPTGNVDVGLDLIGMATNK